MCAYAKCGNIKLRNTIMFSETLNVLDFFAIDQRLGNGPHDLGIVVRCGENYYHARPA